MFDPHSSDPFISPDIHVVCPYVNPVCESVEGTGGVCG